MTTVTTLLLLCGICGNVLPTTTWSAEDTSPSPSTADTFESAAECDLRNITTPGSYTYKKVCLDEGYLESSRRLLFSVQICNDAHVLLSAGDNHTDPDVYEVVIGGWGNQRSAIRPAKQGPEIELTYNTPVSCDEFHTFYVSWADGMIEAGSVRDDGNGRQSLLPPFVSYLDCTQFQVRSVHVSGWNEPGRWRFGELNLEETELPTDSNKTVCIADRNCTDAEDEVNVQCWLKGTRGEVKWTDPGSNCTRDMYWHIEVPDGHGIILEPDFRTMLEVDTQEVCKSSTDRFTRVYFDDVQPVIMRSTFTTLRAIVAPNFQQDRSSLSFRYTAHPLSEMPVEEDTSPPTVNVAVHSLTMYNCSRPYTVPDSLKCDMIQQCLGGEDEPADCHYRSPGCGQDWIPYQDQCLKIVIDDALPDSPGVYCAREYEAQQAALISNEERNLVAYLASRAWSGTPPDGLKISIGFKKVRPQSPKLAHLYRYKWQWGEGGSPIAYEENQFQSVNKLEECAVLAVTEDHTVLTPYGCSPVVLAFHVQIHVCEKANIIFKRPDPEGLHLPPATHTLTGLQTKACRDGSFVQKFHPCPQHIGLSSSDWSWIGLPLFPCETGPGVHYSLVCDGNDDCTDGSDETNCNEAHLSSITNTSFVCNNSQIVPASSRCNGVPDCFDGSDEMCSSCPESLILCREFGCVPRNYSYSLNCPHSGSYTEERSPEDRFTSSGELELDGYGMAYFSPTTEAESCSESHFRCPDGYCIPTYMLINGEKDCHGGEDENILKDNFTCPGYYRCYGSGNCVHSKHVCDGIPHCPNKDDERYCELTCPSTCVCEGYAYRCQEMFEPKESPEVRYLDLSGNRVDSLTNIHLIPFLKFLNLSRCGLSKVSVVDMPLLSVLDLSFNGIQGLSFVMLEKLPRLSHLNLSGNQLGWEIGDAFTQFTQVAALEKLNTLRLVGTGVGLIDSYVFRYLTELTELDLQDNPLRTVNKDAFGGLTELQVVRADDSRLCCSHFYVDQSISLEECDAPRDELSSCSDLLRTDFFRAFLWGLSILAIVGNAGVLIYRVVLEKTGTSQAYSVLVIQLSLSDFLMGVYLAIIGVADAQFRGDYVAKGPEWQDSALCKAAGFLALVSSEVSAFVICLITLDRLLVIRFPLISNLRLNRWSSLIVSSFVWAFGCTLAAIPLTQTSWNFYGQNGICLPLPITRRQFDGQMYAFGVFIILNFALFLFIGAGQALIFQAIRSSRQATEKDNRKQEIAIARRLFLIVMSDFCCWFPIGLMGLLASRGTAIPGEVNVWAAIFVLPLNSALNPFLYTLNTLLERRAREMVKKRIERLLRQLHGELRKWPRDKIEQHIRYCLRANLVKRETVLQWLTGENDGGDKPDGVQGEDPSCLSTSGIDLDLRSSQCI